MKQEDYLFRDEAMKAFNEWDTALSEVAPKVPYGPNYKGMLKTMKKDPRIERAVLDWRRFQHQVDEGVDQNTAARLALEDLKKFKTTFGGDNNAR